MGEPNGAGADAVRALAAEVALRCRTAGLDGHADDLGAVVGAIQRTVAGPAPGRTAASLPGKGPIALRYLEPALAAARSAGDGVITALVAAALAGAVWTQTAAYVRNPPYRDFLAGYTHTALLGPTSANPVAAEATGRVALGVLLLGPDLVYPAHEHPADEVYLPLTVARWARGGDARYRSRPAGLPLHHEPWQPHGMRTDAAPLLALYVWRGDTTTPARFCA